MERETVTEKDILEGVETLAEKLKTALVNNARFGIIARAARRYADQLETRVFELESKLEKANEQLKSTHEVLSRESDEVLKKTEEVEELKARVVELEKDEHGDDEMHKLLEFARDQRDDAVEKYSALKRGIEKHEKEMMKSGFAPRPFDEDLWALLG